MDQTDKGSDTPESRDQFVSEIMDIDAQAAEPPEPKKKRSWLPVLYVLVPAFLGLTVWNVVRMTSDPEVFPPALEEASARFTIYLIAQAVEEYRDSTSALPADLEMIDMDEEGIEYSLLGSTYSLTATIGRTQMVFRQGEDLTWYGDAFQELQGAAR